MNSTRTPHVQESSTVRVAKITWVFLNMHAFCNPEASLFNTTEEFAEQMANMRSTFTIAQIIFCLIGVMGNILNLRTLQSPSLQTVPFMYIRALAVFDLISLSSILIHFILVPLRRRYLLMVYMTYLEAPLINTFLVSGLYCAFMLTIERYLLISRPHFKPSTNPRKLASRKITIMLLWAAILHIPMMLQNKIRKTYDGSYAMTNNVEMLCSEPYWTVFNYYKMLRECIRFFCVTIMTILNIVIARKLQITKMRRRRLVRRSSQSDLNSPQHKIPCHRNSSPDTTTVINLRKEYSSLVRSFTEKKLTVLMIAICIIFILGNVPQMIVMVLQNEAMENVFGFQLYRNMANLLEVVNHCLNFYVFCMASSEYTRAFLLNCICLRSVLLRFPKVADFLAARRRSSIMVSCNMSALTMQNKEYCSVEDSLADQELCLRWTPASSSGLKDSSFISDIRDVSRLKSILVTGEKEEKREKKNLTIANNLNASYSEKIDTTSRSL